MKKKKILIAAVLGIVVLAVGLIIYKRGRKQPEIETPEKPTEKRRITEPVNDIPVAQRPYMKIEPQATGHHINLIIENLVKPAQEMEYELEYQSGSLLQGAFGLIKLSVFPVEEEIMLGSCSAGGACTYHKDIKGGSLLMRFSGEDKYVLKTDWRYYDNVEATVSSRNAKFQLESEDLAGYRYLIVFNSPGAPQGLEAKLKSDVYVISTSRELGGSGTLTIRAGEEAEKLSIYGYNGQDWIQFEATVEGKQVTAQVDLMEAYVVAE